ncbi:MAG: adenylate cyclase [Flavobacteriales bacterium]|jgi:adenylate cyclase
MNKKWLHRISLFTIGWIIALLLWRMVRKVGNQIDLEKFNIEDSLFNTPLKVVFIAVIAGILFGSTQYFFEKNILKKRSFRRLLIDGFLIHFIIMLLLYFSLYVFLRIGNTQFNIRFKDFLTNPILLVNLFYSVLINSFITILIYLNKLLGKGNLAKLLTGRFSMPQEENRVFMFLDLVSSTSLAEKLGHIKYSALIQDCFYDLEIVEQFGVEIYQYVGDEAVLTWPIRTTASKPLEQSLKAYFSYSQRLASKSEYYQARYNTQPVFTAGLHFGMVTAVEVGTLKREIAYHGDTLNTAARIQGLCKDYEQRLLISDKVKGSLESTDAFNFERVGVQQLRGKNEKTTIYSVTNNTI